MRLKRISGELRSIATSFTGPSDIEYGNVDSSAEGQHWNGHIGLVLALARRPLRITAIRASRAAAVIR